MGRNVNSRRAAKSDIIVSLILLFVFVTCCWVMATWGQQMNSRVLVIPFMAAWGLAALLWPAFALRGLRRYLGR
jgi:hypothetical protein